MFDYEAALPHWINRAGFLIRAEAQSALAAAGHDLTPEEWALLMVLWRDGPQTMNRLAGITLRDRTTVTRLVDRLVRKGILERRPGDEDRRQVVIDVTEEGRVLEEPVVRTISGVVGKAMRGIGDKDVANAIETLRQVAGNLDVGDVGGSRKEE